MVVERKMDDCAKGMSCVTDGRGKLTQFRQSGGERRLCWIASISVALVRPPLCLFARLPRRVFPSASIGASTKIGGGGEAPMPDATATDARQQGVGLEPALPRSTFWEKNMQLLLRIIRSAAVFHSTLVLPLYYHTARRRHIRFQKGSGSGSLSSELNPPPPRWRRCAERSSRSSWRPSSRQSVSRRNANSPRHPPLRPPIRPSHRCPTATSTLLRPKSSSFSRHSCRTCRPSSRSRSRSRSPRQHSAALAQASALARIPSSLASRHPSALRHDPIHSSQVRLRCQLPRRLHLALPLPHPLALRSPQPRRAMPQHSPSALPTPSLPTLPSSLPETLHHHHHHSATTTLSTTRHSPLPPHHEQNRSVNRTHTTIRCSQARCTPCIRTTRP